MALYQVQVLAGALLALGLAGVTGQPVGDPTVPLQQATGLALVVSGNGSYAIVVGGCTWLQSAPTKVHVGGVWYSSSPALSAGERALGLTAVNHTAGSDALGPYSATALTWRASATPFVTTIRLYAAAGAVTFTQEFPQGAEGCGIGDHEGVLSRFPSFDCSHDSSPERGFYQWSGRGVPGNTETSPFGVWPPTWLSGGWTNATGALGIFSEDLANSLVLSPSENFAVTQQVYDTSTKTLSFGVRGSVTSVPSGFRAGAIVVYRDSGIVQAVLDWGGLLLRKSGKPRGRWQHDYSLSQLGYTTDNGAYYYYHTMPNATYEQTILALKAYAEAEAIPIKWVLYDSWWYLKQPSGSGHPYDPSHGVLNWTDADPDVFPSGLRFMYEKTAWPVVAHNRAWSSENVYAKQNGGQYEFLIGEDVERENISLPIEQRFWDDLLDNAREWGLLNYQQDWMYTQQGMGQVLESATLGRQWQQQMDRALTARGLNFGFGGATCYNWLESTEMVSVTNGRISNDYHSGLNDDWKIGVPSVFAFAIEVIPAKDGFWTTEVQPGNSYPGNRTEPYSVLQTVAAVLSRGPVSPADKIGLWNRALIMRTCTEDGALLQADAPALAIDAELVARVFGRSGPKGEVWVSATELGGHAWHHVLVAELAEPFSVARAGLRISGGAALYVFDNAAGMGPVSLWLPAAKLNLPSCGKTDFRLLHTAPVLANGWALLGEVGKFIPVSASRITQICVQADAGPAVDVVGAGGEVVALSFVPPVSPLGSPMAGPEVVRTSCTLPPSGRATISPTGCGTAP